MATPIHVNLLHVTGSNGNYSRRPRAALGYTLLLGQDPRRQQFLRDLSRKFSTTFGPDILFTELPRGYSLWWSPKSHGRLNRHGVPYGNFYVFGHPNGCFNSAIKFIVHLDGMRTTHVGRCQCERCST